jgi:uncharacterized protein (TIGR00730 family)
VNICVYCSASRNITPDYHEIAARLGETIAARGDTLVYGGASVGLMGEIAFAVQKHGGKVIGVMPKALVEMEIAHHAVDEFIITQDMRERKAVMETRADAFIALPGGIGTLDEVFELMNLRQLKLMHKPIILLDHNSFYAPLRVMLDHMKTSHFIRADLNQLCAYAADVEGIFALLDAHESTRKT